MRDKILKLRDKGMSYREIETILGCSRGTISYHCGDGQKTKTRKRQQDLRKTNCLVRKTESYKTNRQFIRCKRRKTDDEMKSSHNKQIDDKVKDFQTTACHEFTYKDVVSKFGEQPRCYLTGRAIDLSQPRSFSFDHVIPRSKNGSSTLDNLGITCREANMAKNDMTVPEFVRLCEEVLQHFGFKVEKCPLE